MSGTNQQLSWRKSSSCDSGSCVEVARTPDAVYVRNSEAPDSWVSFSHSEWSEFAAAIRRGELTE